LAELPLRLASGRAEERCRQAQQAWQQAVRRSRVSRASQRRPKAELPRLAELQPGAQPQRVVLADRAARPRRQAASPERPALLGYRHHRPRSGAYPGNPFPWGRLPFARLIERVAVRVLFERASASSLF